MGPSAAGQFAVALSGALLLAQPGPASASGGLLWWDPSTGAMPSERPRQLEMTAVSPDGRRIAGCDALDGVRSDIWIADLDRGARTRITHGGLNVAPVWSADGASVFYATGGSGAFELWRRDADAIRPAERLLAAKRHTFPLAVSRDGTLLAVQQTGVGTRSDILAVSLTSGQTTPLVQTPFDDTGASFSPDSALIAYQSTETGRWEVYVQRRADHRRVVVSSGGGSAPFWSTDGRVLYYRSGERLMRAAILDVSALTIGAPQPAVDSRGAQPVGSDAAGRILFERRPQPSAERIVLTLNWTRELRRLLGPPAAALPR
jgi:Tol biopolymer transport system component